MAQEREPNATVRPLDDSFDSCKAHTDNGTALRVERLPLQIRDSEWAELAQREGNIFLTQEWMSSWWRHYGKKPTRLLLIACRDQQRHLRGVLPLYLWQNAPVRIARLIGHSQADENGFLCSQDDRVDVARAARDVFERERVRLFIGDNVNDASLGDALGATTLSVESSPLLRVPTGGWDAWLGSLAGSVRGEVRRVLRRIDDRGDGEFRLATRATLDADLSRLFALHTARWGRNTSFPDARAFHEEFSATALRNGWLRLWTLELGGVPAASYLGYRFGGVDCYYQMGWDPAFANHKVGKAVLFNAMRDAMEAGSREFRFLRGDEAYKHRYASEDRPTSRLVLPCDLVGRATSALIPVAKSARSNARGASRTVRSVLSRR
jgi:CelD/BcsL family acetyltransferase involved in cellulose biosynthesis